MEEERRDCVIPFCLRVNRKGGAHEQDKAVLAGMIGAGCVERRTSGSERDWR